MRIDVPIAELFGEPVYPARRLRRSRSIVASLFYLPMTYDGHRQLFGLQPARQVQQVAHLFYFFRALLLRKARVANGARLPQLS